MNVEVVPIEELTLDPENARKHPEKNLEAIKGSLRRFGQQKPIVVGLANTVIAGNGTLAAAKELGWREIKVVRTKLTGRDAKAYALADNRTTDTSEWDDAILGQILQDLYEHDYPIAEIGFDPGDYDWGTDIDGGESAYSDKIVAPIYEPKGERPQITELADKTKRDELLKAIEKANLSDDIKDFLKLAAERHTIFNYEKIAEYYAHAAKELQNYFESSALVIIDFDKAIENGFVQITNDIAKIRSNDD